MGRRSSRVARAPRTTYIAYDEVAEMREAQVRFTMGWARTSDAGQSAECLMTLQTGDHCGGALEVLDYFAAWLDPKHPHTAEPGELRWFTTIRGRDVEVPRADPFVLFNRKTALWSTRLTSSGQVSSTLSTTTR